MTVKLSISLIRELRRIDRARRPSLERDLLRACALLRNANPDNRQWMETRDALLEELGAFVEPPE